MPIRSTFRAKGVLMAAVLVVGICLGNASPATGQADQPAWLDPYREPARRIIGAAMADTCAWNRLAEVSDMFGHRLSGSPQLEQAIQWAANGMRADGLENVHLEPVMVPHWVRGQEHARMIRPNEQDLVMLGLGGSIGTPPGGIEAETFVVDSFDALDSRAHG